jgi:hypothetical protein
MRNKKLSSKMWRTCESKGRKKGIEGTMKSIVIEVIGAGGFLPF